MALLMSLRIALFYLLLSTSAAIWCVLIIPVALFLGGLGLAAFLWSLKSGQYDDLDGAANRILIDDEDENVH